ncbi:unnamed protein product, partial [Ixodes persulcatus]
MLTISAPIYALRDHSREAAHPIRAGLFSNSPGAWRDRRLGSAGLTYSDDVVLTAASVVEIQQLLDICTHEAMELGLRFNAGKSAAFVFSGSLEPTLGSLRLGGCDVPILDSYNLWSCNRFIVSRELWKAVVVPGLTFANAVVCVPGDARAHMERRQREIGREALGCHGGVANEAVQGELGWSSFEAREATSKITYYGRLRHKDSCRWARRLFMYTHLTGLRTRWQKRLLQLEHKYGFFSDPVEASSEREWASEVKKKVRDNEAQQWLRDALTKTTLQVYLTHKTTIASEALLYDNSLGSRLLSEARAGALRTLVYRRRFDATVTSSACRVCGGYDETVEHVVLDC